MKVHGGLTLVCCQGSGSSRLQAFVALFGQMLARGVGVRKCEWRRDREALDLLSIRLSPKPGSTSGCKSLLRSLATATSCMLVTGLC